MKAVITPILIPGLICTKDLFRHQLQVLSDLATKNPVIGMPLIADTLSHDSFQAMALAALETSKGPIVAIGLSMGGYVAMEMACLEPDRVQGLGLLSTSCKSDTAEKRAQRVATIKMAEGDGFRGTTRNLLSSFLSPAAEQDEELVARVLQMAQEAGQNVFIAQQTAILNRRDHSETLANFKGEVTILCGLLDQVTPPERSKEMAALAASAKLHLLPEIGHLSSLEAPIAVSCAVTDLLQRSYAAFIADA